MAKSKTKNVFRVIVSILFLAAAISYAYELITGAITLSLSASPLIELGINVLMLFAGLYGLAKTNAGTCRVLGILILAVAVLSFVLGGFNITFRSVLCILLPVLYIIGVG